MSTSAAPIVADSRSRVGLLVMDGLLVLLMSWLLYVVVADRSAASASEEALPEEALSETPVEGAAEATAEDPASAEGEATPAADGTAPRD